MPTPDLDVANHLAAAAPAPDLGTVGTDIFRGPARPAVAGKIPHAAIFCLATGGVAPEPYFRVGASSASFYRANVQVRVRGDVEKFLDAQTKARQVKDKLHLASIAGYVAVRAQNAEPLYLGQDDLEHHEFSVNVTLWYKA